MQISLAKHKTMEVAKQACHFGPKIVAKISQEGHVKLKQTNV